MVRFGLDYSFDAPVNPTEHHSVGSTFAVRYLNGAHPKAITRAEVVALHNGKISVVVVYESTARRALEGHAAGIADARAAVSLAGSIGLPGGRPIYFAVDFDATPGDQAAINNYFKGIHEVLDNTGPAGFPTGTPVGVYSGYWPLKRLFDAKLVDYGWQTYAWSGRNLDKRACLYQFSNGHGISGHAVDYNHALKTDFGQWPFEASPTPPPKPKPHGVAKAELTRDIDSGHWTIHGTKADEPVVWNDNDHWYTALVRSRHGVWEAHPLALDTEPKDVKK